MGDLRDWITRPDTSLGRKLLRTTLRGLSVPYWMAAQGKNLIYDVGLKHPHRSQLPTISVGNLSVGGTGKSPVVAWLAAQLQSAGVKVAILSRGYGRLPDGRNDEALELETLVPNIPHFQHWDRVASSIQAEAQDVHCLLLDDAFQHRRIARDLDIVLIDATDPPHVQQVLPGGLFREPLSSLKRAQVVMLSRADSADPARVESLIKRVNQISPQALVLEASHHPKDIFLHPNDLRDVACLRDKPILACCGIGNPDAFYKSLNALGAHIIDRRTFPDHHAFGPADVDALTSWVQSHPSAEMAICTMKDYVKLQSNQLAGKPLGALRIELSLTANGRRILLQLMESVLGRRLSISGGD